ncbi:MAG: hypothetical protein NZL95_08700 [Chitinophagales bacterium]|nr:hypothetical protein [Chitinophagales bacterium]MDW8428615.1 hypothetical protein [Chitinophagales bacterium]
MHGLAALFLLVLTVSQQKCREESVPLCIQQMIEDFSRQPPRHPPYSIYSYTYQGRTVYYVQPPCCDQLSKLYDADCNLICAPDGGITGRGDGRCPDFYTTRTHEQLIWTQPVH